jgi:hypothetical protein
MKTKKINQITPILVSLLILIKLALPSPVQSFNLFKEIWRGVTKTSHFIAKIPDKTTRWMGPVVGPIAKTILLKNIAVHKTLGKIFSHANKVQKIRLTEKEVQQALADMRKMYRDEANKLYTQADNLQEARDQLGQQLVGRDISLSDYQNQILSIDKMIDLHDQLAEELNQKADNFRTSQVTKIIGKNLFKNLLGEVKNIITQEASNELINLVNVDVIDNILSRGGQVDTLLDVLMAGDLSDALKGEKNKLDIDALKERIRNQIKQAIKDNKDNLSKNWQQELKNIINQSIQEIKDSENNLEEIKEEAKEEAPPKSQEIKFTLDENGCKPGWVFNKRFSSCVQENCDKIPDAHYSYEGYCVCGSSGSIEENLKDPNQECKYKPEYTTCSGCVYACVHLEEDCPLEGIGDF